MSAPKPPAKRSFRSRVLAALLIATLALAGLLAGIVPPFSIAVSEADTALYDASFKIRPPQSRLDGSIVIIQVDQPSI